jgi:UDPglucose 6-dehydrogenase
MIGIIGYGFVGKAIAHICSGEPLLVVDPVDGWAVSLETLLESKPKFIFICVPTPDGEHGCDDSIVLDYVTKLVDYEGTLIVKSTVPPSSVEKIIAIRPDTVIWPEFLREAHWKTDIMIPDVIVVGAQNVETFEKIKSFIWTCRIIATSGQMIKHVTPVEASIFKYTVNSFLAAKVTFMHQMALWTTQRGGNWDTIADLLEEETRIGETHLRAPGVHGYGFDGSCFPKDTVALASQARLDGSPLTLLEHVINVNNELRKIK